MDITAISPAEKQRRAALPIVRFINGYLPLSLSRWMIKQTVTRYQPPDDVTHQIITADGVPCHWLIPAGSPSDRVLLYLHGGGFVLGMTGLHLAMVATLAQKMGVRTLMVDYRLAPEHPFPAALSDCSNVYRWLLKQNIPAQNIVIAGDSAGGNLAITTLMALRDAGTRLPAAAACLSPVGNLADKGGLSDQRFDPLIHQRAGKLYTESYVAKHDPANPLISPVFGDWQSLPPLLIHCGEDELLREDSIELEARAKASGVDVRLEVYPRMWHVWQINLDLPQTDQSLTDIAAFLRR